MWTDGSLDGKIARLEGIRRAGLEPWGESTRYIWEQPSVRLYAVQWNHTSWNAVFNRQILPSTSHSLVVSSFKSRQGDWRSGVCCECRTRGTYTYIGTPSPIYTYEKKPKAYSVTIEMTRNGRNGKGLGWIDSFEPLGIETESNISADRHVGTSRMRRDCEPPAARRVLQKRYALLYYGVTKYPVGICRSIKSKMSQFPWTNTTFDTNSKSKSSLPWGNAC